MSQACRYLVSGRVQGVWFRESTRRKAQELGITGHAINLPDGRVEVLACGSQQALDELHSWLHSGPPLARVSEVSTEPCEDPAVSQFSVG